MIVLGERVTIVNDTCGCDGAASVAAATGERVENPTNDVVGAATGERVKNSADAFAPCKPNSAMKLKRNLRRVVIVCTYRV